MRFSGKLSNSSHISKQREGVWMFLGMMAVCGDPLTVNSSLRLKSNTNALGGNVSDSPEEQTAEREAPRKYGNDHIHAQGDLMAH